MPARTLLAALLVLLAVPVLTEEDPQRTVRVEFASGESSKEIPDSIGGFGQQSQLSRDCHG